jgi:hypothetical protein
MTQESAIDVKMYEFGRLVDDLLDAAEECERAGSRHFRSEALVKYKQARERVMGVFSAALTQERHRDESL